MGSTWALARDTIIIITTIYGIPCMRAKIAMYVTVVFKRPWVLIQDTSESVLNYSHAYMMLIIMTFIVHKIIIILYPYCNCTGARLCLAPRRL